MQNDINIDQPNLLKPQRAPPAAAQPLESALRHSSMSFLLDLVSWTIWLAGLVAVTAGAVSVFQFVRVHFLRAPTSFSVYGAGEQHWALVTGASDGIGKQYAIQLVFIHLINRINQTADVCLF